MLGFRSDEKFDLVLFFESFHHCDDHVQLLRNVKEMLRPGGHLLLASEPIEERVHHWGVRLDGGSVWAMREHGWLELGFTSRYLSGLLKREGWSVERRREPAIGSIADILIATKP
jgi:SAM-dependent methyltransferase